MANTTVQDQWIGERTVIGTATEVTTLEDDQINKELPPRESIPNPQPKRKIDQTILDKKIAQNVTTTQRQNLQDLDTEFSSVFADSNDELGVCNIAEHEIDTGDAKPVFQHPFSIPSKAREIIHQQVVEMDKRGII